MDFYSSLISILLRFLGISLYLGVSQSKRLTHIFPRQTARPTPIPEKRNVEWHMRMQPPKQPHIPKPWL